MSNKLMVYTVLVTVLLQLALVYVPFLQNIFKLTAMTGMQLLACFVVSFVVYGMVEGLKKLNTQT